MSKVQVKIQRARSKGIYLLHFSNVEAEFYCYDTQPGYYVCCACGGFEPIGNLTRREAVNLAYKLSLGK